MITITGPGVTESKDTIIPSSAQATIYTLNWIIVDATDPENKVQVDVTTLTTSPTLTISRRFHKDHDFWEQLDASPIDLTIVSTVDPSHVRGGDIKYTLTNLDSSLELWLRPNHY